MLKKLLKEMITINEKLEMIEERWNAFPENEEYEADWDEAYKESNHAMNKVASYITSLIHVDEKTARIMITKYPERLMQIAEMEA